jgi:hypothetical protein
MHGDSTLFLAIGGFIFEKTGSGNVPGDFDVGKQFPNFWLHEVVQPFCGVEIPDDLL